MAPPGPDLDEYRRGVEAFLAAPAAAPPELRAVLFGRDVLAGLLAAAEGGVRPARPLARFAAEGLLREAGAEEIAEVEARLREPAVLAAEGLIGLTDVDAALAEEPDAERRAELQAARLRALDSRVGALLSEARERREAAARDAGAASPEALLARAAAIDLEAAARDAVTLLDETDDAAGQATDRLAREALGIPGAELSAADLPRLVRAPHLEGDLGRPRAVAAVRRTLEGLGLADPGSPPPPASALAGLAGHLETLRLAGTILAAAGASPRLTAEARLLPDPALTRAHGNLWEGLAADPAWVARVLGHPDATRTACAAGTVRLLALRATAARAAALGGADAGGVSRALGLAWPAPLSLADPLAGLGPVDEIRGAALAAALAAHLSETYGARWFAEERAGALLAEIQLEAGTLDPAALARELGAPGLDPGPLAAQAAAAALGAS
jgi:hypothetical protein